MGKIKQILFVTLSVVVLGIGILFYFQNKSIEKLRRENTQLYSSLTAYEIENSSLNYSIRSLELSIDQLVFSKDSITQKLNQTRKELGVKNKQIKSLQYIASQAHIIDTVVLKDTIFKETVKIDTALTNPWYNISLSLQYPNLIGVDLTVPSEKQVIISARREVVNPSKCKLKNLFKKKYTVTEVEVLESNPYITSKQNRFIEITR